MHKLYLKSTILLTGIFVLLGSLQVTAQSLEDAFNYGASGILAQKVRMGLIARNVANLTTLEDEETGLPWQKRFAVLEPDVYGVRVVSVEKSNKPFGKYYDPAVPQSNEDGFTAYPNVNLPDEMVNMAYTEIIFEANVKSFQNTKALFQGITDMIK